MSEEVALVGPVDALHPAGAVRRGLVLPRLIVDAGPAAVGNPPSTDQVALAVPLVSSPLGRRRRRATPPVELLFSHLGKVVDGLPVDTPGPPVRFH